ncbi:hypothetical protein LINPERHAP1_LOCUS26753 [Linum perenne]
MSVVIAGSPPNVQIDLNVISVAHAGVTGATPNLPIDLDDISVSHAVVEGEQSNMTVGPQGLY